MGQIWGRPTPEGT